MGAAVDKTLIDFNSSYVKCEGDALKNSTEYLDLTQPEGGGVNTAVAIV